jgi:hypothetical protein
VQQAPDDRRALPDRSLIVCISEGRLRETLWFSVGRIQEAGFRKEACSTEVRKVGVGAALGRG